MNSSPGAGSAADPGERRRYNSTSETGSQASNEDLSNAITAKLASMGIDSSNEQSRSGNAQQLSRNGRGSPINNGGGRGSPVNSGRGSPGSLYGSSTGYGPGRTASPLGNGYSARKQTPPRSNSSHSDNSALQSGHAQSQSQFPTQHSSYTSQQNAQQQSLQIQYQIRQLGLQALSQKIAAAQSLSASQGWSLDEAIARMGGLSRDEVDLLQSKAREEALAMQQAQQAEQLQQIRQQQIMMQQWQAQRMQGPGGPTSEAEVIQAQMQALQAQAQHKQLLAQVQAQLQTAQAAQVALQAQADAEKRDRQSLYHSNAYRGNNGAAMNDIGRTVQSEVEETQRQRTQSANSIWAHTTQRPELLAETSHDSETNAASAFEQRQEMRQQLEANLRMRSGKDVFTVQAHAAGARNSILASSSEDYQPSSQQAAWNGSSSSNVAPFVPAKPLSLKEMEAQRDRSISATFRLPDQTSNAISGLQDSDSAPRRSERDSSWRSSGESLSRGHRSGEAPITTIMDKMRAASADQGAAEPATKAFSGVFGNKIAPTKKDPLGAGAGGGIMGRAGGCAVSKSDWVNKEVRSRYVSSNGGGDQVLINEEDDRSEAASERSSGVASTGSQDRSQTGASRLTLMATPLYAESQPHAMGLSSQHVRPARPHSIVTRQPRGPPSSPEELAQKNFASRMRVRASANLGLLSRRSGNVNGQTPA